MKKFFAWIGGITVVLMSAYFLFRYRDTYMILAWGHTEPPTHPESEKELAEYKQEVADRAQELAKMKAEEALKKWKERFRSNRTSP